MFCECKWKENVDAEKVARELKEKSKLVKWKNDERKEYYAIFAKSFEKKIEEPNTFLFSFEDLEGVLT